MIIIEIPTVLHLQVNSPGKLLDGCPLYVVEFFDPADGTRIGVWDGNDHEEAIQAAEDCAAGGMHVLDLAGAGLSRH